MGEYSSSCTCTRVQCILESKVFSVDPTVSVVKTHIIPLGIIYFWKVNDPTFYPSKDRLGLAAKRIKNSCSECRTHWKTVLSRAHLEWKNEQELLCQYFSFWIMIQCDEQFNIYFERSWKTTVFQMLVRAVYAWLVYCSLSWSFSPAKAHHCVFCVRIPRFFLSSSLPN